MKSKKINGPHIKDSDTTSKIMTRLLIALAPIVCFALFKNSFMAYFYSEISVFKALHPIFIILVAIISSYASEILYFRLALKHTLRKSLSLTRDSFTIIPGLFLALIIPINTPLWIVAIGAFCANIIGKMLFGGFGQNIFNPALIGYLIIYASYGALMGNTLSGLDTVATATPLANLASLNYYGTYETVVGTYGSLLNFLCGSIPGTLGEVSKLLIIIAFIYLTVTKTIKWRIPTFYIATVFIITLVIGLNSDMGIWYPVFHILSGGLLFGAVFMATDPVTSPITNIGQVFYGIALGILTVSLRFFTSYPEGCATSILCMNILVPVFDKIGVYLKYNIKRIYIPIIISLLLVSCVSISAINKIRDAKKGNDNIINEKVKIDNVKVDGDKKVYSVSSKGWGVVKADVEVVDKKIISIIVTDSKGETQWSEIEKNNYIYKVVSNQENIDDLDAVSGSTFSSDALKNMVKKVMEEELNEK